MTETTATAPVGADGQAPSRPLTLVCGDGRTDVVVDENLTVGDVLELTGVAARPQLTAAPVVLSLAGQTVSLTSTVAQARLDAGSVLLVTDTASLDGLQRPRPAAELPPVVAARPSASSRPTLAPTAVTVTDPAAGSSRSELAALGSGYAAPTPSDVQAGRSAGADSVGTARSVLGVGLALVAAVAILGWTSGPLSGPQAPAGVALVAAGVLLLGGLALAQPATLPRPARSLAPALGTAAGAIGGGVLGGGQPTLELLGAAAGTALVALGARGDLGPDRRVPQVWAGYAALVGVVGLWALGMGASLSAAAALLLAAVCVLPRVLPQAVVDVEDVVLLDIDRLSVTSWSPRERRRRLRTTWRIDQDGVEALVRESLVTQTAALVGGVAVSVAGSVRLGLDQLQEPGWPTAALLAVAALALALGARAYRRRAERVLLRLAAIAPAAALFGPVAARLSPSAAVVAALLAVVAALVLVRVARSVAQGYVSLAAGRLADALESLSLVAVWPLALWVAGLVDWALGALR